VSKLTSLKPLVTKWLKCSTCEEEVQVEEETVSVTCWKCAMKKTEPPAVVRIKKTEGPRRPKGYHLMTVYVDPDGNVFHKGVEQPKLKGTLPSTPVKPKKTKAQKALDKEKRDAKLVKWHKRKQELKANEDLKSLAKNPIQEIGEAEPISSS
jgi:DNA-directed RNA polymerase subunit RPC12/RpoP